MMKISWLHVFWRRRYKSFSHVLDYLLLDHLHSKQFGRFAKCVGVATTIDDEPNISGETTWSHRVFPRTLGIIPMSKVETPFFGGLKVCNYSCLEYISWELREDNSHGITQLYLIFIQFKIVCSSGEKSGKTVWFIESPKSRLHIHIYVLLKDLVKVSCFYERPIIVNQIHAQCNRYPKHTTFWRFMTTYNYTQWGMCATLKRFAKFHIHSYTHLCCQKDNGTNLTKVVNWLQITYSTMEKTTITLHWLYKTRVGVTVCYACWITLVTPSFFKMRSTTTSRFGSSPNAYIFICIRCRNEITSTT